MPTPKTITMRGGSRVPGESSAGSARANCRVNAAFRRGPSGALPPSPTAPSLHFITAFSHRLLIVALALVALTLAACKKDAAVEAMDTDANGYVCLKCQAKLYTERSVFIGPK